MVRKRFNFEDVKFKNAQFCQIGGQRIDFLKYKLRYNFDVSDMLVILIKQIKLMIGSFLLLGKR